MRAHMRILSCICWAAVLTAPLWHLLLMSQKIRADRKQSCQLSRPITTLSQKHGRQRQRIWSLGAGPWSVQRSVRSRARATHTNASLPAYLGNLFSIKEKQRIKLIPSSSSYEVFSTVFRKDVLAHTRVVLLAVLPSFCRYSYFLNFQKGNGREERTFNQTFVIQFS